MPTILTHPAAALLRTWFPRLPTRVVVAGVIGSVLPDVDVIGFAFRVPYGSLFGHRGFTHSIFFAVVASLLVASVMRPPRLAPALAFIFFCTMSHATLDAFTNGGMGIAFFSPFSNRRYFFPWTPIRVSPIGRLSLRVLMSEARWVWVPFALAALLPEVLHRDGEPRKET
ncbi:MAG TPA: metal-dependent hydrolase [Thermoanaerobaculia bacterium]|nr:metal-dependent hydrolase [Thermoanaerobaculia bacterium]